MVPKSFRGFQKRASNDSKMIAGPQMIPRTVNDSYKFYPNDYYCNY